MLCLHTRGVARLRRPWPDLLPSLAFCALVCFRTGLLKPVSNIVFQALGTQQGRVRENLSTAQMKSRIPPWQIKNLNLFNSSLP